MSDGIAKTQGVFHNRIEELPESMMIAAKFAGHLAMSVLATAVLSTFLATNAAAQDAMQDAGWYLGGNVGQSRSKIDDPRIIGGLLSNGLTVTSIKDDDRDTGYKLFGGYQFNRYVSVEGGYFDLGRFGFTATTLPAGTLDGRIRIRGLNLDLVGTIPVTEQFSVFGRVGVNSAQARDHFTGTGSVFVTNPDPSRRDANVKFGAGLQYRMTRALSVRAEAERYRINDAVGNKGDIDLLSIGLVYRFGVAPAAYTARAAEPVPYAPPVVPVAPAPRVVAPVAPPAPVRVSFSADSLFDFDRSILKPEGRAALDKFAADLRGTDFDVIQVVGHTDRLGSHAYNQALSERRAAAVKAYLVENAGIPPARIASRGVDGTQPVTQADTCKGNKPTPALIACLQPDRRVEVEVTGVRGR